MSASATTAPRLLTLGMLAAEVRALQGEPTAMRADERWDYDSSWVRFDTGKVVDWYSSPLHPLRTSHTRPPPRH